MSQSILPRRRLIFASAGAALVPTVLAVPARARPQAGKIGTARGFRK